MAFQNFKPEVWSSKMQDDLDKMLVFKENCNHSYEGDAKGVGDGVRILCVGDVPTYDRNDGHLPTLNSADDISGTTLYMPINHVRYFNFKVGDLDKAQAQGGSGLLSKYTSKASTAIADKMDAFIAGLHVGEVEQAFTTGSEPTLSADPSSASYILKMIDDAYLKLLNNNVSRSTKVTLTVPPALVMLLKRAYVDLDTNNSEMMKNGRVGRYGGIEIKESNNCKLVNGVYHLQLKTDDAIAFVNPYTHTEGYRPDLAFEDCVKGYSLFDGKVVAPKQAIDFNIKL